ncbi:MAG: DUF3786 domain-containing protein [Candidatus Brocadiia bacterium]
MPIPKPPEPQHPIEVLWQRLRDQQPEDVARRAAVEREGGAYLVPLLDQTLRVTPDEERVDGPGGPAGFEPTLVCVQYLLCARDEPLVGELVDPKSLTYGDFFFRGQHELPTDRLTRAFGARAEAFQAAGAAVGGDAREMGDAAFEFRALPRLPVTVVYWAADDEFPARAQFLFDRTADRQLPVDALWVLARVVAKRLAAAAG